MRSADTQIQMRRYISKISHLTPVRHCGWVAPGRRKRGQGERSQRVCI